MADNIDLGMNKSGYPAQLHQIIVYNLVMFVCPVYMISGTIRTTFPPPPPVVLLFVGCCDIELTKLI